MTIKDILFQYIYEKEGIVDFDEITQIILSKKPTSKWKLTHWSWYKTQITSPNGKYYTEFTDEIIENILGTQTPKQTFRRDRIIKKTENVEKIMFEDKTNEVEKELAIILGKVSHHIHPEIVEYIKDKNIDYKDEFIDDCHPNLDYNIFLYDNSDCIFPGIRRPVNKEKNNLEKWKNNINESDGTIFNDNTYPRFIWTYLSLNKGYNSNTWKESGLNSFELAHIFGHKEDEKELEKTIFKVFDNTVKPYSLFTSASNIVLIPKGLTKPTDKMDRIKICFYKRHIELYGENFIGMENFNNEFVPVWYSEIKWLEPKLPVNWKERIDNLLNYRKKHLKDKYNNASAQQRI